ncbi:glucosamine-6-phosphate deaminase [Scopulibacillus daqui]|uniref:Glucosamine-6-phosphate deaminase n=1 Tax=Scopulibacillus daqui TaxID=1469162 RepID=A0ABS2Q358_9BACL|nr:glucosamine-6-phosphate deaminase [Scopulibacillus daqui]MBM7646551.1 glucosamine-6-phosphate deaminase [Scopulibacillus daqui]
MKIIQAENYKDLSEKAAKFIIDYVRNKPDLVLGLATGGTPEGTYEYMVDDFKKNKTTYKDVKSVNLDEYVGLSPENPNSYHAYMYNHLFKHIDIPENQRNIPNGAADDLEAECKRYDQLIASLGGVDLQLLGIGHNGHIGFNEPGTSFEKRTHLVELTRSTRRANARFFNTIDEVPTHALTMGIKAIMESKHILLIASGKGKAEAMRRLICEENISEDFPASSLQDHSHVTIIADKEALSLAYNYERRA